METLLDDYKRRLKTVTSELTKGYDERTDIRLRTKASCFRTFISELERIQPVEPEWTLKEAEQYINDCTEKATPGLSKIKDIDKALDEIRGREPKQTSEEIKNKIYDKITDDLKGSRLEGLETNDGDKYPLIDFLSSGTTIKEGLSEVHNLVEQIDIDDLMEEYARNQQPKELVKLLNWIDKSTYWKEDNDIPTEFIVDEYLKAK